MPISDASPRLRQGPVAPDDFYRALGYAIVAFTEIDEALFTLYYALTIGTHPDIAQARKAYYDSWNFAVRLRSVDDAVRRHCGHGPARADWERLRAQVEVLNERRNELAHSSAAPSFERDERAGLSFAPVLRLPADVTQRSAERLDTPALLALAIEFEDMADAVGEFLERVAPDPGNVQRQRWRREAAQRRQGRR